MDKIKPVACLCETALGSRYWTTSEPLFGIPLGEYYDQSAIDAMRAEVERLEQILVACHAESVERWKLLLVAETDAKRYRWLRDFPLGWRLLKFTEPSQVDAAIDAATKGDA